LLLLLPSLSSADALENAYFVCDVFEKAGISTECQVAHVLRQINVHIDTSAAEAQEICAVMVRRLAEKQRLFGRGWKLNVLSSRQPAPLAECPLP
jgi:hypothetical protein